MDGLLCHEWAGFTPIPSMVSAMGRGDERALSVDEAMPLSEQGAQAFRVARRVHPRIFRHLGCMLAARGLDGPRDRPSYREANDRKPA